MSPLKKTFHSQCHINEIWDEETVRISNRKRWLAWVWRCFMSSGHVSLFIGQWKSCQLHISWQLKKFKFYLLAPVFTEERGDNTTGVAAPIWIWTLDKIRERLNVVIQPCFYWWKQNREDWLKEDPFSLSVERRNEWQNDATGLFQKWNNLIVSSGGGVKGLMLNRESCCWTKLKGKLLTGYYP